MREKRRPAKGKGNGQATIKDENRNDADWHRHIDIPETRQQLRNSQKLSKD